MKKIAIIFIIGFCAIFLLNRSQYYAQDTTSRVRNFTRGGEFDYISWTLESLKAKAAEFSTGIPRYLSTKQQHDAVVRYSELVRELDSVSAEIRQIYADPGSKEPEIEAVLQQQLSAVVGDLGLTFLGQPLPAVLFDVTPLPMALIVSPRNAIRQDANISMLPDITLDQIDALEKKVAGGLDVSALVVPVGGIGMYPTMVMSSSDLPWLIETVSHEWIHNYLTLHPLGINYETTPELRTMNETAASIAGKEISEVVIARYYPELVPQPTPESKSDPSSSAPEDYKPRFNFNREMHTTRIVADGLLERGLIDRAEKFMDDQREVFWKNGYQIRKINQAYFAFYGAYADQPGGAAGEDPVGPAVRALRERSGDLADFLKRIAGMTSFEQLQEAVGS
jgi:hypothetical protein